MPTTVVESWTDPRLPSWEPVSGPWGAGNGEVQHYLSSGRHAVSAGTLVVTARRDGAGRWTSARLHSRAAFRHGRLEFRAQLPCAQGAFPAVWLLGKDHPRWPHCGELDVVEAVSGRRALHHTAHGGGSLHWQAGAHTDADPGRWHDYAIDKAPGRIRWYVDGALAHEVTPKSVPAGGTWPFEVSDTFVVINLAVGGTWAGLPDASTPSELVMRVGRMTYTAP